MGGIGCHKSVLFQYFQLNWTIHIRDPAFLHQTSDRHIAIVDYYSREAMIYESKTVLLLVIAACILKGAAAAWCGSCCTGSSCSLTESSDLYASLKSMIVTTCGNTDTVTLRAPIADFRNALWINTDQIAADELAYATDPHGTAIYHIKLRTMIASLNNLCESSDTTCSVVNYECSDNSSTNSDTTRQAVTQRTATDIGGTQRTTTAQRTAPSTSSTTVRGRRMLSKRQSTTTDVTIESLMSDHTTDLMLYSITGESTSLQNGAGRMAEPATQVVYANKEAFIEADANYFIVA